jgi:hypothetical protein
MNKNGYALIKDYPLQYQNAQRACQKFSPVQRLAYLNNGAYINVPASTLKQIVAF